MKRINMEKMKIDEASNEYNQVKSRSKTENH